MREQGISLPKVDDAALPRQRRQQEDRAQGVVIPSSAQLLATADLKPSEPGFKQLVRQSAPGWLVSAAVHGAILIALGLMVVAVEQGGNTQGLLGSFAEGDREAEVDVPAIVEIAPMPGEMTGVATEGDLAAGGTPGGISGGTPGLMSDKAGTQIDIAPVDAAGPVAGGGISDQIAIAVGNGDTLDGIISGPPGGDGGGGGAGEVVGKGKASFFGIEAKGYKFVYIVDASGSMFGPRFGKAHAELMNSLRELDEHQSFYVIFFNSTDYPQFFPLTERNLAPVSPKNIQRVTDWISSSVIPQGETIPNSAISRALALNPDAIFLLSDGEFNEGAALVVQQENYRKTPIHTIAFESEIGAFSLGQIARMTNGKYRFVP